MNRICCRIADKKYYLSIVSHHCVTIKTVQIHFIYQCCSKIAVASFFLISFWSRIFFNDNLISKEHLYLACRYSPKMTSVI